MDKDIIERLRSEANVLPHEVYSFLNPLLIEAADEIERLWAALKEIQARAVGVNPPRHTWYYDRAESALAPQSSSNGQ